MAGRPIAWLLLAVCLLTGCGGGGGDTSGDLTSARREFDALLAETARWLGVALERTAHAK
jgi:hypothetical protein